ncbi:hypothetical protein [Nonomuraea sp. NPDC050786]|uniref:hypothetical protein n=1 Tax=Nonomuraea sp. NPDC050786 TaxID=3154840 RepID=UPI0033E99915
MARFPAREEIAEVVIEHVRRCLGLADDVEPLHGAVSIAKWHRKQIRTRQGVTYDKERARTIAAEAITEAAQAKNNPPA